MNTNVFLLGILEILSAFSIGLLILSTTYKLLKWYGHKRFNIGHNNQAYSILIASVLFGMGYMVSGTIEPIISTFRLLSNTTSSSTELLSSLIFQGAMFIVIAYGAGLVISISGVVIYSWLTPIDEFSEIKNNNVGVAVICSAIIVTLILMSRDGVVLINESFIPYPELPPK